MNPRPIEEVRSRATMLQAQHSWLVQRICKLEDEIAELEGDDRDNESGSPQWKQINIRTRLINELDEDKLWIETTLESLEWVLGETDVKPEEARQTEWEKDSKIVEKVDSEALCPSLTK